MNILVTYADKNMTISKDKLIKSALANGIDYYDDVKLKGDFMEFNRDILNQPRGAGYWLWKPYVLFKALSKAMPDDVIVYSDAGVEFVNDIRFLTGRVQNVFLFANAWNHKDWCKRRVFDYFDCREGNQVQASVILVRNTPFSRQFVKEWMLYCQLPGFIDDVTGTHGDEYPQFKEHRHDQAILCALQQRYNISLHWWPAMYNNGAFTYQRGDFKDDYPVIFHHHRKRDNEW